jgi:hypothetical protein
VNYAALQARVRARLNTDTSDPLSASLDEMVNEALHYLDSASPTGWPWTRTIGTFSTVNGTSAYPFATVDAAHSIAKILGLKVLVQTNYYEPLNLLGADEAWQIYPSTLTRRPESYFVEGKTVYLAATPDGVYTIGYRAVISEPDLAADADEPILPVTFHGALVEATLLLAYQTLQDMPKMQATEQRVTSWLTRMRTYGVERPANLGVRVRDWL